MSVAEIRTYWTTTKSYLSLYLNRIFEIFAKYSNFNRTQVISLWRKGDDEQIIFSDDENEKQNDKDNEIKSSINSKSINSVVDSSVFFSPLSTQEKVKGFT